MAPCLCLHGNWQPLPTGCFWESQGDADLVLQYCVSYCYRKMSFVLGSLVKVLCSSNYLKKVKCLLMSLMTLEVPEGSCELHESGENALVKSVLYYISLPSSTSWDTYAKCIDTWIRPPISSQIMLILTLTLGQI